MQEQMRGLEDLVRNSGVVGRQKWNQNNVTLNAWNTVVQLLGEGKIDEAYCEVIRG
jgi:hypothetical protein